MPQWGQKVAVASTGEPQLGQYLVACIVGGAAGGGGGDGWLYGVNRIEKNAIASISHAIQTIISPTKMIVSTAPQNSRVPAVRNIFSPEWTAIWSNARLKFIAIRR